MSGQTVAGGCVDDAFLRLHAPAPLRKAYLAALATDDLLRRHTHLQELGECALHYFASIAVSEYLSAPDDRAERTIEGLFRGGRDRLSLGTASKLLSRCRVVGFPAGLSGVPDLEASLEHCAVFAVHVDALVEGNRQDDLEAAVLARTLGETLPETPWGRFWWAFVDYRNQLAHAFTRPRRVFRLTDQKNCELMTPCLQAALVEALTVPVVRRMFESYPVLNLEEVTASGGGQIHRFRGEICGKETEVEVPLQASLLRRWRTRGWRAKIGSAFVVRCESGDPTPIALYRDLEKAIQFGSSPRRTDRARPEAESRASRPHEPIVSHRFYELPFIGRERELRAIEQAVLVEAWRLVTLTGAAGIGKTRLAMAFIDRVRSRFGPPAVKRRSARDPQPAESVVYVDLQEKTTVSGIVSAVAEALRLPVKATADTSHAVCLAIRKRSQESPFLLVLDNFERAHEHAKATVGKWRSDAPEASFVVTSRRALDIARERVLPVHALPSPTDDAVVENECVRLFVEVARLRDPDFAPNAEDMAAVAAICRHLDGMPLAIELVAKRTQLIRPVQILAELAGSSEVAGDELSRSLHWSYSRLTAAEQSAFCQFSVFRGGFTLEAAAAVIALSTAGTLDVLEALHRNSLLIAEPIGNAMRYRMLRPIQAFGRRQWDVPEVPSSDLLARWGDYYVGKAEGWNQELVGRDQHREALDRLSIERENLLGIHELARRAGEHDLAARALLACERVLATRGPATILKERIEATLATAAPRLGPELRARLLRALGEAKGAAGDLSGAVQEFARAADATPAADAPTLRATILARRGWCHLLLGTGEHRDQALSDFAESQRIFIDHNDPDGEALCLVGLGVLCDRVGQYGEAFDHFECAEAIYQGTGAVALAKAHNYHGLARWHAGQPVEAERHLTKAITLNHELGDEVAVGASTTNRGLVLLDLGRIDEARSAFSLAAHLHQQSGNRVWRAVNLAGQGWACLLEGQFEEAELLAREAEAMATRCGSRDDIAMAAGIRARALIGLGRASEARDLFKNAMKLQCELGSDRSLRYFGNLCRLADLEHAAGESVIAVGERVAEARKIKDDHGLESTSASRAVRDDVEVFESLERRLVDPSPRRPTVSAALGRARGAPVLRYPWQGVEQRSRGARAATCPLFLYGSLLDWGSRRAVFGPDCGSQVAEPVLAFGARRKFSHRASLAEPRPRVEQPIWLEGPLLNVQLTADETDVANGLLVEVPWPLFERLRRRQHRFDLAQVVVAPLVGAAGQDGDPASLRQVYVLAVPDDGRQATVARGPNAGGVEGRPNRAYVHHCLRAARAVSDEFERLFQQTTFMADGVTPIPESWRY